MRIILNSERDGKDQGRDRDSDIRRSVERNLRITGTVLFVFFLFSELSGFVLSRTALWSFQVRQAQAAAAQSDDSRSQQGGVDFALWSPKRIKAYKEALAMRIGAPMAVLTIPRIGVEAPVFEGTDELILNRGAGWIAGTVRPGERGNAGIAAHRDGFFRKLKDIQVGDQIRLVTPRGNFEYAVEKIEIVDPSNVDVLQARSVPSLTLVTCYPFYFVGDAPQRYIVHASLLNLGRAASSLASAVSQTKMEVRP